METKTYTVYKYNELPKETQAKVLDRYRNINTDYDSWDDCVLDERRARLELHGFSEPRIYYSGFWSQGDGACFVGSLDNDGLSQFLTVTKTITKYPHLTRALKRNDIYINIKITHNYGYYHAYSTSVEDYTEMQDNSDMPDALRKEYDAWFSTFFDRDSRNGRIGWYIDECISIYKALEAEYEYQTDEDSIIETIEANDYDFTEDGKID